MEWSILFLITFIFHDFINIKYQSFNLCQLCQNKTQHPTPFLTISYTKHIPSLKYTNNQLQVRDTNDVILRCFFYSHNFLMQTGPGYARQIPFCLVQIQSLRWHSLWLLFLNYFKTKYKRRVICSHLTILSKCRWYMYCYVLYDSTIRVWEPRPPPPPPPPLSII